MPEGNHAIQNGLRSRIESLGAKDANHFNVVVVEESEHSTETMVSVFFCNRHFCIPIGELEVLLQDSHTIDELSTKIAESYEPVPP